MTRARDRRAGAAPAVARPLPRVSALLLGVVAVLLPVLGLVTTSSSAAAAGAAAGPRVATAGGPAVREAAGRSDAAPRAGVPAPAELRAAAPAGHDTSPTGAGPSASASTDPAAAATAGAPRAAGAAGRAGSAAAPRAPPVPA